MRRSGATPELTIAIVAAVALVSFAVAFWLGRRITSPILKLSGTAHDLADGDLSITIPALDRRDEGRTMAQAIAVLKERAIEAARLADEQDRLKATSVDERKNAMRKLADAFE